MLSIFLLILFISLAKELQVTHRFRMKLKDQYRRLTLLVVLVQALAVIILESLVASVFLKYFNALGGKKIIK